MEKIDKPTFDRLYALKIANLVEHYNSFSKVAGLLDVSVSFVTKEIQKLESHFQTKIFNRTTRAITVTEEGKFLLEKSAFLIESLQSLEQQISGDTQVTKGRLNITAPVSIGELYISNLLFEFQKTHPYIDINLILTDDILDPINNDIDMSIRTAHSLRDSNLYFKKVGTVKRGLFASEKYLNLFKAPKKPEQLKEHNCLIFNRAGIKQPWVLIKDRKVSLKVSGTFTSNNLNSIKKACEENSGIANLPLYMIEEKSNLVKIFKQWNIPTHSIYLLTSTKPTSLRKLKTLVDFLTEKFSENKAFN